MTDRFRLFALLVAQVFAASLFAAPQKAKQPHDAAELQAILEKCAEYCEKLDKSVLYFVCREKLVEEQYEPHSTIGDPRDFRSPYANTAGLSQVSKTREFVYDYQLVRKAGKIEESRTLIKENGEARK